MQHVIINLKKKNGKLVYASQNEGKKHDRFVNTLPEGARVETCYEIIIDDGSLPQLRKLHGMIRDLAAFTGYLFEDLREVIKYKAGLCIIRKVDDKEFLVCKSLADCSKDELSLAIEACNEFARTCGFYTGSSESSSAISMSTDSMNP